ncbi:MAG: hypothetical protein KIS73_02540 [Enhydrobacter sp.]|nr:hypothetical protein [Enhydrobacter sp.]
MSTKKRPIAKKAKKHSKPSKRKPAVSNAPVAALHTNPARAAVAGRLR